MAEAGTIERDHAVIARQAIEQAARLEVALRHHVAVDQHDRRPFAVLDDMQAHAVDLEQSAGGRLVAFGAAGAALDPRGGEGGTEQRGARPEGGARGRETIQIGSVHCASRSRLLQCNIGLDRTGCRRTSCRLPTGFRAMSLPESSAGARADIG